MKFGIELGKGAPWAPGSTIHPSKSPIGLNLPPNTPSNGPKDDEMIDSDTVGSDAGSASEVGCIG
jgi:hypothetical protein